MKKVPLHVKEKYFYIAFRIGIFLKGLNALVELVGGALLLFLSNAFLTSWILGAAQQQLIEDPDDHIAHFSIHFVNQLSVSTQHFVALYLLIHGAIKIILVHNLFRGRLWAYPTSIAVFFLFIMYQLYRFSISGSYWLLLLSFFDLLVMLLTVHEYNRMRKNIREGSATL